MEYSKEQKELLKKCDEVKQLIAEAREMCDRMIEDLEEDLEETDEPEVPADPEDDADWIIIF